MRRIIMMVIRNIPFIPAMWIRLCYHASHVDKYTDEEHKEIFDLIVRRANKGGNVTIESYGQENLPEENGYMLFPNHQGLYDVLAIVAANPKPFSVVAKTGVDKIPLLKQVIKSMKGYIIDRDDVRQSMQIIINVTKEVLKGRNYLIFAEGTRSKNGNNTLEFKGGSFKAATKAKCPIVPVALIDSFKPFDSKSLKKVTVQVHFLKPLLYEDYKEMKTTEIAEIVRNQIQEVLERYRNEK